MNQYDSGLPITPFNYFQIKVLCTGGFDPFTQGHARYLEGAYKSTGRTKIHIGLNSDAWLSRKKGKFFMDFDERKEILLSNKYVYDVYDFDDSDGTAIDFIERMIRTAGSYSRETLFVFANGGDRRVGNIPEYDWAMKNKLENVFFMDGAGGDYKASSSSDLLTRWTNG